MRRLITRLPAALAALLLVFCAALVPGIRTEARAAAAALPDGFLAYLEENIEQGVENVDVEAFSLYYSDELDEALTDYFFSRRPDLFHVALPFSYSGYGSGLLSSVNVAYTCTPAEYAGRLGQVEAAADRLLRGVTGNDLLSDVQKALLIHDRLALHCEYQLQGADVRNIYGALVERRAVCEGYARAYKYLLEAAGIRCELNSSVALRHMWNIVIIDGTPYHVDVAKDDPEPDVTGRVLHTNFLLSSAALYRAGHAASDYDVSPQDTKYDNAVWQNSVASFVLAGGGVFYIDNVNSSLKDYTDKTLLRLSDDFGGWFEGERRIGCCSRLATDGTYLFYTDKRAVQKYDLYSGKSERLFAPSDSSGTKVLFGMAWEDGKLICDFPSHPSEYQNGGKSAFRSVKEVPAHVHTWDKGTVVTPASADREGEMVYTCPVCHAMLTEAIPPTGDQTPAAPVYGPGDADGDGKVTSADARLTLRASVKLERIPAGTDAFRAADADRNGTLSAGDARLILRASVGLESL